MTTKPDFLAAGANIITNPCGAIDQEGANVTVSNTGGYGPDRWKGFGSGTGDWIIEQTLIAQGTLPKAPTVNTAVRCRTTTGDGTPDAGDYYLLRQIIQGHRVKNLMCGTSSAKTVTISFYAQSSVAGSYTANLKNNVEDRFYNHTFALAANTWTYVEFDVAMDQIGTWEKTTGRGLLFSIDLGSGSTYQNATTDAWGTGAILTTTGQTSLLAGPEQSTFDITAVQIKVGGVDEVFEEPDWLEELQECKRFLQRSYNYGVVTGTSTALGVYVIPAVTTTNGHIWGHIEFEVEFAEGVAPSCEIYHQNGTVRALGDGGFGVLLANSGLPYGTWANSKRFAVQNSSGSQISPSGQAVNCHYKAWATNF